MGLLAGTAALIAYKGGRSHALMGEVFTGGMIVMALIGAYQAIFIPEYITVLNGVFTAYLVASSWLTIQKSWRVPLLLSIVLMLLSASLGAGMLWFGYVAAIAESGEFQQFPPEPFWFFGSAAILAAILDGRVLLRGSLPAMQRLARHLWRMCFALFIACASFFLGQQQVFPEFLQGSWILALPVIASLLLLFYWLLRVLVFRKVRH
jgi:hypothetical protein